MRDRICLTGLRAFGHHGVFEHERREGQLFVVDVVIEVDTRHAASTDELRDTVNYATLADRVVARVSGEAVNLLETLAAQIAEDALELVSESASREGQATGGDKVVVEVTVHKPAAPLPHEFADVSVTIRRESA